MLYAYREVEFFVEPVFIPFSKLALGKWRLLEFQVSVYKNLENSKNTILVAPTGSGKTLTLLLGTSYGGAVGVYPNNTLLKDQRKSIDKILREALGAEIVDIVETIENRETSEVLRVYRIGEKKAERGIFEDYDYVAVATVSGRFVKRQIKNIDEKPRYKRDVLLDVVRKVQSLGKHVYKITLTTPDTMLLIMMGMYRDFEDIGKTVHNTLYAIQAGLDPENIIRKSRVATRNTLSKIRQIKEIFFDKPLFIDEFHLYDAYGLDALIPLIWIQTEVLGSDTPIIFSSATPSEEIVEEIEENTSVKFEKVVATTSKKGFLVRGTTRVKLGLLEKAERGNIELGGLRGAALWFYLGDLVPSIICRKDVAEQLKQVSKENKHAVIILDRVYQVVETANTLTTMGFPVSCETSVKPSLCADEASIIVGSEAITQGINLKDAVLGITVGYSPNTVIQRIGRIGRGTGSTIYMLAVYRKHVAGDIDDIDGKTIPYNEFITLIEKIYPDIDPKKMEPTSHYSNLHITRRTLLKTIGVIHLERVTGVKQLLEITNEVRTTQKQNKLMKIIGSPDTLAKLIMFRPTGFTVNYIIKDDGKTGRAEIGVILRNFRIEDITLHYDRDTRSNYYLEISLEKTRQRLLMDTPPGHPYPYIVPLEWSILPLKQLLRLGYRIYIREQNEDNELEIPPNKEIEEQVVALVKAPERIREYIVRTARGLLVKTPYDEDLIAIFL